MAKTPKQIAPQFVPMPIRLRNAKHHALQVERDVIRLLADGADTPTRSAKRAPGRSRTAPLARRRSFRSVGEVAASPERLNRLAIARAGFSFLRRGINMARLAQLRLDVLRYRAAQCARVLARRRC